MRLANKSLPFEVSKIQIKLPNWWVNTHSNLLLSSYAGKIHKILTTEITEITEGV